MVFINNKLKISSFGSTHDKEIGVVIEGLPAGITVDGDLIDSMLSRRRPGQSILTSSRKEEDIPIIKSGIIDNKTNGDTITVVFENKDVIKVEEDYIPRPGHGDFSYYFNTGEFKKGATSARFTVGIVFAAALCKQYLLEKGIFVNSRMIAPSEEEIIKAKSEGDSIGGIVETNILGLSAGFGSVNEKIESKVAAAVFNIPGVRGLEFGLGFELAGMRGSKANDPFTVEIIDGKKQIRTVSNNCGGLLGGMASGSCVNFKTVFKPTPSIAKEQQSVNLKSFEIVSIKTKSRNDPCIAVRGAVVVEAASAIALTDICLSLD